MGNIAMLNQAVDGVKREFTRLDNMVAQPEECIDKQAGLLTVLYNCAEEFNGEVAQLKAENARIKQELIKSEQKSEKYRRMLFGASSDRTKVVLGDEEAATEQLCINDEKANGEAVEDRERTVEEVETPPEESKPHKHSTRVKGMREATLRHLEEFEPPVIYELPKSEQICDDCASPMEYLGKETVRWELVHIRAKVYKRKHVRYSYICKECQRIGDKENIKHAKVAPALQKGSLQSPSVNAHVFNEKFVNAMPIDRIAKAYERDGAYLKSTELVRWTNRGAHVVLKPLYDIMLNEIRKEAVVHVDATHLQVNHEPGRAAQTPSCVWQAQTGMYAIHQIVLFFYFLTENVADILGKLNGFKGYLQCDGKGAYHKLPAEIIIVGCWQHMRDYITVVLKSIDKKQDRGKSPAAVGLKLINEMFALERKFVELKLTIEQRYQARLTQIKPLIDKFYEWIDEIDQPRLVALNPGFKDIVGYARRQRQYLENTLLDGRLELSNNRAERVFVRFAIGRNNYLACQTPYGAEALVINYTIALSALANGIHPEKYYEYLFERIPNAQNDIDYNDYLPWSDKLPQELKLPPTYKDLLEAQKLVVAG